MLTIIYFLICLGAGKTTFLSAIAGRPEASLHVQGQVLHYQQNADETTTIHCAPVRPGSVAWLQQHDAFFERLTVKETLNLAVFLELPSLSGEERDQVAQSCLDSLGLSPLKSRPVGSPKASRTSDGATLSGGEMRRLSVAVELVVGTYSIVAKWNENHWAYNILTGSFPSLNESTKLTVNAQLVYCR